MTTRILVVEDDERIRTAVRLALQKEGWEVLDAATGEEALQIFQSEKCDILLIDIMLPGIDGCLLYTSPSPRDLSTSRMPSSA